MASHKFAGPVEMNGCVARLKGENEKIKNKKHREEGKYENCF